MMHGLVNINYEAMLRLVIETDQQRQSIDAIINTTFKGYLGLPKHMIAMLDLPSLPQDSEEETTETFYRATVIWGNETRSIPITVVSGEPVVGMSLLQGYSLQIQVTQHGLVTVNQIR
ncbi:hypothetical protein Lepto7376_2414 [[Leptolyngbya] sp. PCC 7376]|uniref:hypothetical protein n=1 Tax=[Leptolyngbya] sp. PCC 7376 TaxID=111781 RepID=UPI00029F0A41|nr:hypothetical protein [[Leptolyngbya] sp. PCC 7376]AFY38694.1 hypothetical protein Lepto7376_2414 [[Leptolyngbya] sp. PCC 7376]